MLLEGSCHCGAVRFRVESPEPYPFMYCYCSICRKTAGGGGYAINLGALTNTLEVEGEENLRVYNAKLYDREATEGVPISEVERNFCGSCGSARANRRRRCGALGAVSALSMSARIAFSDREATSGSSSPSVCT